ncbi:MAG: hypothetical protein ACYCST_20555 [Acidimicrobiales bacterium]
MIDRHGWKTVEMVNRYRYRYTSSRLRTPARPSRWRTCDRGRDRAVLGQDNKKLQRGKHLTVNRTTMNYQPARGTSSGSELPLSLGTRPAAASRR